MARRLKEIICIIMIIACLSSSNESHAKSKVVYASEIKKMVEESTDVSDLDFDVIYMDVPLELDYLCASTIRGSSKLTLKYGFTSTDLNIEDGADVTVLGGITMHGDLNISKGSTLRIISRKREWPEPDWEKYDGEGIISYGMINTSGNLYIDSDSSGIGFYLLENRKKGINVYGGNVSIKSKSDCIMSAILADIIISGGNVTLECESSCISMGSLYMSGGRLHTKTIVKDGYSNYGIDCDEDIKIIDGELVSEATKPINLIHAYDINIASDLYIKTPFFGRVRKMEYHGDFWEQFDDYEKIVDANDDYPTRIEITKIPSYRHDEWVNGVWYDSDGKNTYAGVMSWKSNSTGWWIEDTYGWYPTNQWQKIDGYWYYFDSDGYMVTNEWRNNRWIDSNGVWSYEHLGVWASYFGYWWYEDSSGWYPKSCWQKIDGNWYYFRYDGYMATECYINGWWVDENGVCR